MGRSKGVQAFEEALVGLVTAVRRGDSERVDRLLEEIVRGYTELTNLVDAHVASTTAGRLH